MCTWKRVQGCLGRQKENQRGPLKTRSVTDGGRTSCGDYRRRLSGRYINFVRKTLTDWRLLKRMCGGSRPEMWVRQVLRALGRF